jgi:hypothetical protein
MNRNQAGYHKIIPRKELHILDSRVLFLFFFFFELYNIYYNATKGRMRDKAIAEVESIMQKEPEDIENERR